jgi:hypothetical protein
MAGLDGIELLAAVHTGANRLVDATRQAHGAHLPASSTVGVGSRPSMDRSGRQPWGGGGVLGEAPADR